MATPTFELLGNKSGYVISVSATEFMVSFGGRDDEVFLLDEVAPEERHRVVRHATVLVTTGRRVDKWGQKTREWRVTMPADRAPNSADEVARISARRIQLLRRIGESPSAEDSAEFEALTMRMRELLPRVTPEDVEHLAAVRADVEAMASRMASRK